MRIASGLLVLLSIAACSNSKSEPSQVVSLPPVGKEQLATYQKGAEVKREEIVSAWPDWLEHPKACPADVMPVKFEAHDFSLESCQGEQIKACLRRCEFFDAASCYSAALILESPESVDPVSPALFARACQYGSASGCTNWTAGTVVTAAGQEEPSYTPCQERSFEGSCTRGQDPWGCAMYAHALAQKAPAEGTRARIEIAAQGACRLGEEDPACQTGKEVLRSLAAASK